LDIIEKTGKVELLFDVSESAPGSVSWVAHCLRQLIQKQCVSQLFSPRLVSDRWDALSSLLSVEEPDHLLAKLLEETNPVDYIREEFEYGKAGLYAAIVRSGGAKNRDFRNWCLKSLRQVPEESWREELSEEGDLLELVIDILDSGYKVGLGVEFQDALLDYAVRVIEGQIEPERLRDYLCVKLKGVAFWSTI
jgi:hypothetical protein